MYQIGNVKEILTLQDVLPRGVFNKIYSSVKILDEVYGNNRDYMVSGGYALVLHTKNELENLKEKVNYEELPCEWVMEIEGQYLSALFLLNDDYAVLVVMPIAIAPENILKEWRG